MNNRLISMAAVLLGAMMLSACGQTPDNTGNTDAAAEQSVETAVGESAEADMEQAGAAMEQQATDAADAAEGALDDEERGGGIRHD